MENSVCCLFDGRGFPGNRGSAAVLFGSQSRIFFKYLGEITLIFKADGKSDVKNRPVRGGKKFFAFLDADRIQIFFEGRTAGLLEERRKVGGVQLHMVGSFFQGKRSVYNAVSYRRWRFLSHLFPYHNPFLSFPQSCFERLSGAWNCLRRG